MQKILVLILVVSVLLSNGLIIGAGTQRRLAPRMISVLFSDSGQRLGKSSSSAVALGDLDGDGDLDAFAANDGFNRVWLNNPVSSRFFLSIAVR